MSSHSIGRPWKSDLNSFTMQPGEPAKQPNRLIPRSLSKNDTLFNVNVGSFASKRTLGRFQVALGLVPLGLFAAASSAFTLTDSVSNALLLLCFIPWLHAGSGGGGGHSALCRPAEGDAAPRGRLARQPAGSAGPPVLHRPCCCWTPPQRWPHPL